MTLNDDIAELHEFELCAQKRTLIYVYESGGSPIRLGHLGTWAGDAYPGKAIDQIMSE